MTATLQGLLTALFTDPVYGLPLTLFIALGLIWLYLGKGTGAPLLQPYRTPRVRSRDPVSSMYWALTERRYSDTILFVYQRLSSAFLHRYRVPITNIPWRRKHQHKLGIYDPKPYNKVVREMVLGLNAAQALEHPPSFRAVWQLMKSYRERKLQRHLQFVLGTVEWMIPDLESGA